MSVEVRKGEKVPEFFDGDGCGPVPDGCHLPLIHLDTLRIDLITMVLHCGLIERTFQSLKCVFLSVQAVLSGFLCACCW